MTTDRGPRRSNTCARTMIAALCASVLLLATLGGGLAAAAPAHARLPLISRNVPAYTNDSCDGQYPGGLANDGSYDTQWRTCSAPSALTPLYLAYDLSAVPAARRTRVVVAWYNDPTTNSYDHTYVGVLKPVSVANDIPSTYTVEANRALGGTLPTAGWVTLVSVSGNSLHSRQHAVDLTGFNWVRLQVTASDGTPLNQGVFLNLDVHDATAGVVDDWIFFGDSITEAGMAHSSLAASGGRGTWAQVINTADPTYFPAYENGGIGGSESSDGASRINGWLATFPGRYVGLSYGGNDAGWSRTPSSFYDNYVSMVRAVLAYGKIPVVPKVAWSCDATLGANAPALNQQIDRLYAAYPSIVRGPDLWTFFRANPTLISSDCIHPTGQGYVAYRQQWATAMLAAVYR